MYTKSPEPMTSGAAQAVNVPGAAPPGLGPAKKAPRGLGFRGLGV